MPSCRECNAGTSRYDEEFKVQLSVYLGVGERGKECLKRRLWDSVRKTFKHKPSWRNRILEEVELVLPVGMRVPFPQRPVAIVIGKIIRGLHWKITGEVIPAGVDPTIWPIGQGESLNSKSRALFDRYGSLVQRCGSQFEVIYAVVDGVSQASMWLIRFYGYLTSDATVIE